MPQRKPQRKPQTLLQAHASGINALNRVKTTVDRGVEQGLDRRCAEAALFKKEAWQSALSSSARAHA